MHWFSFWVWKDVLMGQTLSQSTTILSRFKKIPHTFTLSNKHSKYQYIIWYWYIIYPAWFCMLYTVYCSKLFVMFLESHKVIKYVILWEFLFLGKPFLSKPPIIFPLPLSFVVFLFRQQTTWYFGKVRPPPTVDGPKGCNNRNNRNCKNETFFGNFNRHDEF